MIKNDNKEYLETVDKIIINCKDEIDECISAFINIEEGCLTLTECINLHKNLNELHDDLHDATNERNLLLKEVQYESKI